MNNTLSIIIPAYNEENRIGKTLEAYGSFFKRIKKSKKIKKFEILVVLNACKDDTIGVIKKFKKKYKEIRFLDFEQGGKGFAIIEGFRHASARGIELIGFVDADMATSPESFYDLVKKINGYDGIIASRWKNESVIKTKQTFLRIITSRGFNLIVRIVLHLLYSDTQCGAKLFKKKAIEKIINEKIITEWAFDVDLLYNLKQNNFKIKEIPTVWEDKRGSKLNLMKVPLQMFASVVRLRLVHSPFKFIVRLYDKLPERMKINNL
ncbi:glycosyltransferase [Candidatus Pacearchaeota archaeon]|nr:glycosyltransferase [Candidatus Pacearchaeota archaeon]